MNLVAILSFYLFCFKVSKILARFGFEVCFKSIVKFSPPKDHIPFEKRSGIYFIYCFFSDLGFIGQERTKKEREER